MPVRALIVGDGPERAALQRQAAGLGLGEAAIFTGRVPAAKVREFHALLDVFVVPRTPDRVCQLVTPLKPVEAMASGLCVVTSEVKALAEIIKHEVTGALTIPQDPVALADSLELLFYSPDIRRKLGDNAREWVARDRTWAHNAARYRDAYARLGANLGEESDGGMDVLVIGLGYVGLPLAIQAARSGFRVTGYDTSEQIVAGLMAGPVACR